MPIFSGRRRNPTLSLAVVGTLVVLTAVHAVGLILVPDLTYQWALMPGELVASVERIGRDPAALEAWIPILTIWSSVLVHANVMHLAFNAAYLYFFGTLLYQLLGNRGVLAALALTSVSSGLAFVFHQGPDTASYVVGASGAISGVAGLFCLLAFRWEDSPLVYAWPLARPVAPAQAALVAVFSAAGDIYGLREGASGVALDAHVGGFAGGLLLGAILTTVYPTWDAYLRSALGPGRPT